MTLVPNLKMILVKMPELKSITKKKKKRFEKIRHLFIYSRENLLDSTNLKS